MKQSVNESEFRDNFKSIRPDNFSYAGLTELYEYLEQYEEDCGTEMELDVIALCCDFSEYTIDELETNYGYMLSDDDEKPEDIDAWADFLQDRTTVIPVHYRNSIAPEMDVDSLIIQAF